MSTVYLHIGYPKTGTSSIQVFLRDNAPALQSFGYFVPLIGQGRVGGHHALVRTLIGLPVSPRQAVSEAAILSELSAAKDRAVLISSEMLSGLLGDRAQAQTLFGKLRGSHPRIVLIMYVRNQPQFLNSAYSQGVKSFRRADDFRAYLAQVLSHVDQYSYNRWIPLARDLGIELRARPFSKQIREDGIIRDYLRAVDLPDAGGLWLPGAGKRVGNPIHRRSRASFARRHSGWARRAYFSAGDPMQARARKSRAWPRDQGSPLLWARHPVRARPGSAI